MIPEIYEEWILPYREDLQHSYFRVLEQLFVLAAREEEYTAAVYYAERLILQDPLGEKWYRQLIHLHSVHGNRAEARRIYNLCAETLRYELDVEPSPQTQEVFQRFVEQKQALVRRHNFPAQSTPFIGREAEVIELVKYLQDKDCRLLTLVGPGGIGKTRLAIQASLSTGMEYGGDFEQGIYFISLISVESPGQLVPAISSSLGLVFQERVDPRQQLIDYLAQKSTLLLLDNFEHLHQARDFIVQIGREAPDVKLLITSRERLNLKQEWVYEVKGLGLTDGESGEQFEDQSGVRLFYSSASRVHVDSSHLESNYPAVQKICLLVEGNPLAIELAASWTGVLTPEEITQEIEAGLDLLATSQIDIPERHRSMRAVFTHSWKLLSSEEQMILRRLAIFQGHFDRLAAREIAGVTLRTLSSLVDKSLLHRRPDGYYDMHRLMVQFAGEKQAALPKEARQIAGRFSGYYLDFLYTQEGDLRGKELPSALRRIAAELGHIRAAWSLAIEQANFQALGRSASALYLIYDLRGWFEAGADLFAMAAESVQRIIQDQKAGEDDLLLLHTKLCVLQATMNYRLGHYDQAEEILKICGRDLESLNQAEERAVVLLRLGQIAFRRGEYEKARAYIEKSLEIFRDTPNRWETATALSFLGDVTRSLGEYNMAKAYLYEALAMRREIGNQARVADSLNTLGIVLSALGDYSSGLEMFQESLAIRRSLEDPWGVAKTLNNLAILLTWMGEYAQAREHHVESLALRREIGNPFGIAIALHNLGDLAYRSGDHLEAEERFHEALLIRRRINARHGIASTLNLLAHLALEAGDEVGARHNLKEALQMALEIKAVPITLAILEGITALLIKWGMYPLAFAVLSVVMEHPGTENDTREKAKERLSHLQRQRAFEGGDHSSREIPEEGLDQLTDQLLAIL